MEEDWDNIPGINQGPEYLDQNASSLAVESKYSWCNENFNIDNWDLTKINSNTCNASTNYTDWDPTNNNGYTDDDKMINIHCNYHNNESFDDTGCAGSNQPKFDVEYQTDTSDCYKNNGQTNLKSADPQFTNDSWGNPISYDQVTNSTDTGNYSEFDGFTKQNNYNKRFYQKSKNNGFHKSGRGYQQDARFAVEEVEGACNDVTQTFIEVNRSGKKNALVALLNETNDCQGIIVFVEQKKQADFIAAFLSELNYPTTSLHGDRLQPEREKALRDFKTKKMKILVATAGAARGLDITGVTMVVIFDLPKTIEEYVHRIGRTGNLENCGRAISFYDPAYDSGIAPFLVNTLKQADQDIPEFLSQYNSQVELP